jgi:hypothetical protein
MADAFLLAVAFAISRTLPHKIMGRAGPDAAQHSSGTAKRRFLNPSGMHTTRPAREPEAVRRRTETSPDESESRHCIRRVAHHAINGFDRAAAMSGNP